LNSSEFTTIPFLVRFKKFQETLLQNNNEDFTGVLCSR